MAQVAVRASIRKPSTRSAPVPAAPSPRAPDLPDLRRSVTQMTAAARTIRGGQRRSIKAAAAMMSRRIEALAAGATWEDLAAAGDAAAQAVLAHLSRTAPARVAALR